MLTIEDIRSTKNVSGFSYVVDLSWKRTGASWRARSGTNPHYKGEQTNRCWRGPRRATPEEAAQDYCDYINGSTVTAPPRPELKSAGHKRVTKPSSPAVQEARRVLRELQEAEAATQPQEPGYIYLAAESFSARAANYDSGWLVNNYAVKVGHSDSKPDEGRMGSLQTGNPRILVLLGTIRGTWDEEQAMHAKYIHDNVLHEWFLPSQKLLSEFGVEMNLMGNGCMWVAKEREAA